MTSGRTSSNDIAQLAAAFETFTAASGKLEASYRDLETQVAQLHQQLAASDRDRQREADRNERLVSRLNNLLEALPSAVVVLDAEGMITECNSGAAELLEGAGVGMCWAAVSERLFETGVTDHGDLKLRGGRRVHVAQRALGREPGTVLLLTDVTEERKVEDMLARHERLIALGEMVAALAHQVRTPVSSALLYTSNAVRPEIGDERRSELIHKAMGCLHDLEKLVGDMLLFAKGEHSSASTIFDLLDLFAATEKAVEPLVQSSQTVSLQHSDKGLLIRGNRQALAGAVQNLIINALQNSGPMADVRVVVTANERAVELRITDNGPGIPVENRERIFEPFFTGRPDGTGLGLAVARSIIRAHEGDIYLADSESSGTTFVVSLPRVARVESSSTDERAGQSLEEEVAA